MDLGSVGEGNGIRNRMLEAANKYYENEWGLEQINIKISSEFPPTLTVDFFCPLLKDNQTS